MKLEIYDRLRERILYLEYEPGSILNEQTLADEFKVSRTPLRTVLLRLEWEHLVKILPRTGIQITELELNRITRIYQARLEIEDAIGRMAAKKFSPAHFEQLDWLLKDCTALMNKKDPKALAAIDFNIKKIFHEAADNTYLTEAASRFYALTFRLWYSNMLKMNIDEWNQEIVAVEKELTDLSDTLARKDAAEVGKIRKNHLLSHLERIRSKFFDFLDNV